jgi:hypothetical protein
MSKGDAELFVLSTSGFGGSSPLSQSGVHPEVRKTYLFL